MAKKISKNEAKPTNQQKHVKQTKQNYRKNKTRLKIKHKIAK